MTFARPLAPPEPAPFAAPPTALPAWDDAPIVDLDPEAELEAAVRAVDWDAIAPRGWYAHRGRRVLDLLCVALLLPVAAAPMLAVALANLVVFRDPRKVLFTQQRVGLRGERFTIYKFRTMREARDSAVRSWASGADRLRVTPLGRFLRNAHLDELPQLWNILRGDMGIIGPRPEMVEIEAWAAREVPGFVERLRIRPGITGWAQITQGYTGRCARAYADKLAANEAVTCRPDPRRDLEILARTALWMLRGKGWEWTAQGRPRT